MASDLKNNFKRFILVVFWVIILFVLIFGFNKVLFFLPDDFLGIEDAKLSFSVGISFLLLIYLGLRYEKMQNEIYKWKNKDKIINPLNKHIFERDDE